MPGRPVQGGWVEERMQHSNRTQVKTGAKGSRELAGEGGGREGVVNCREKGTARQARAFRATKTEGITRDRDGSEETYGERVHRSCWWSTLRAARGRQLGGTQRD
ncbi:hypothetical protein TRVL_02574 [Trypanosoma vivax]|nr:hypothetical protein TRVL_02574 [Trypanosoma vivax]